MKFYEEAPEREDVLKNAYIANIRKNAKYADEEFLTYATDPKNIVVHKELACYLTATYGISIRMTYRDTHYYYHTKGLNVEARSDKLYITKDEEQRSYDSDEFRSFNYTVTRSFVGKGGNVHMTDARSASRLTRLDDTDDYDKIKAYFRKTGFDDAFDFFDHVNEVASSPEAYRDEVAQAKEAIHDSASEATGISAEKVSVSKLNSYAGDGAVTFGYAYTVGVTYAGKQYYGTYTGAMSDVPFLYSQKALSNAKNRAEVVKDILTQKKRTDTIVYLCALLIGLAVFALTVVFSLSEELSARYSESWIRFFTLFPYSLIVLIPLALLTIAYVLIRKETAYRINYAARKAPSDETASDLVNDAMRYGLRTRKIFLYIMTVVMALYVVFQAVTFIWGPDFPVPQSGNDGTGGIGNTYTIATAEDLEALPDNYEGRVVLEADIDLGGVTFDGIDDFSGTFEGNGHTISNFALAKYDLFGNSGFFNSIQEGATVSGLTLSSFTCNGGYVIGGLVGRNQGRIENCAVINCRLAGDEIVGAVAADNDGEIARCCVENATLVLEPTGLACYAGGIAGSNGGTITNCYAEASISAQGSSNRTELDIGGLVGYNTTGISNSYFSGEMSVTGTYERLRTGGLAGYNRNTVTGCWYYSERTSEFGTCSSDGAFTNCYSLSELVDEYGSLEQAVEQTVGSIEWLSGTLRWDTEVWTADGSGYPKLVNNTDGEE